MPHTGSSQLSCERGAYRGPRPCPQDALKRTRFLKARVLEEEKPSTVHVLGVPSKQEQALSRRPLIRDIVEKDPQVQNTVATPTPLPLISVGGITRDQVQAAPDFVKEEGVQRWEGVRRRGPSWEGKSPLDCQPKEARKRLFYLYNFFSYLQQVVPENFKVISEFL